MTKSSNPSILESCRTEYVLMVVKMSIILARRRWKVSNFPKIYISLKSNCFSFGFCFSFCFVSWKQDWYPWRPEAKSVRKAWPRIEYPLNIYTTWVQPLIKKEQDRGWGQEGIHLISQLKVTAELDWKSPSLHACIPMHLDISPNHCLFWSSTPTNHYS